MMMLKTGNPLAILLILQDGLGNPIEITQNMTVECSLIDSVKKPVTDLEVSILDQTDTLGGIILSKDASVTSTWKRGMLTGDIKLTIDSVQKNSDNFSFSVVESIT